MPHFGSGCILLTVPSQIGSSANRPLVLVVEDEPISLRAMVRLLKSEGYDVRGAESAEEAGAIASSWAGPIIALVDFNLPGKDGLELIASLCSFNPSVRSILITASNHDEVRSRAMEQMAVTYLQKPMNFSELLEIMAKETKL